DRRDPPRPDDCWAPAPLRAFFHARETDRRRRAGCRVRDKPPHLPPLAAGHDFVRVTPAPRQTKRQACIACVGRDRLPRISARTPAFAVRTPGRSAPGGGAAHKIATLNHHTPPRCEQGTNALRMRRVGGVYGGWG